MWRPRKSLGLGMTNLIILFRKRKKIHTNHQKFSFFHFLEKNSRKSKKTGPNVAKKIQNFNFFVCILAKFHTKKSHWLYVVSIILGDFLLISYLEHIVST
jgi:hypothetical protein